MTCALEENQTGWKLPERSQGGSGIGGWAGTGWRERGWAAGFHLGTVEITEQPKAD